MNMVTLVGPGVTYYADWYKPTCLDFAAKTIALHMKKIGPTQLKAGPHVSGRKIDADSGLLGVKLINSYLSEKVDKFVPNCIT